MVIQHPNCTHYLLKFTLSIPGTYVIQFIHPIAFSNPTTSQVSKLLRLLLLHPQALLLGPTRLLQGSDLPSQLLEVFPLHSQAFIANSWQFIFFMFCSEASFLTNGYAVIILAISAMYVYRIYHIYYSLLCKLYCISYNIYPSFSIQIWKMPRTFEVSPHLQLPM